MSTHTFNKMLYTEGDRPCGLGGRGESVLNGGGRRDQGRSHQSDPDRNCGPSENRGSRGDENRQGKSAAECWYCGKKGHKESECSKKRADSEKTGSGSGQTEKGNRQRSHYAEGSKRVGKGAAFMTRHEANSMKKTTPKLDEVWYVDSGASNHMMSHKEWFSYLEKPEQPRVVATGDDTPHSIENVGEVPLSKSDRSLTRGCKSSSRISGASSRKKSKLLRKGTEMGGCSSSTKML